jgi:hypothetical protein
LQAITDGSNPRKTAPRKRRHTSPHTTDETVEQKIARAFEEGVILGNENDPENKFAKLARLRNRIIQLDLRRQIDVGIPPAYAVLGAAARLNADALAIDAELKIEARANRLRKRNPAVTIDRATMTARLIEPPSASAERRRLEAEIVELNDDLARSEISKVLLGLIQESGLSYDRIAAESGVARRQLFAIVHEGAQPQNPTCDALSGYFSSILNRPISLPHRPQHAKPRGSQQ